MVGSTQPLISVKDVSVVFSRGGRHVRAVDHASLDIEEGESVAIVGESGSGKSTLGLAAMGLLGGKDPGPSIEGSIFFGGVDVLYEPERNLSKIRGVDIAAVFQDAMSSLNPSLTVGFQVMEPLRVHLGLSRAEARERAVELLRGVGIPNPAERMSDYPHQFSGGMRQRAMIAMALICEPRLLIADEPTTALDVSTQAQVVDVLKKIRRDRSLALIFISHDLLTAAALCDRVIVMYAGQIVEDGPAARIFSRPSMPYTAALVDALPTLSTPVGQDAPSIPGAPPDLSRLSGGCRFAERCRYARDICFRTEPLLSVRSDGGRARCHGTDTAGWVDLERTYA